MKYDYYRETHANPPVFGGEVFDCAGELWVGEIVSSNEGLRGSGATGT